MTCLTITYPCPVCQAEIRSQNDKNHCQRCDCRSSGVETDNFDNALLDVQTAVSDWHTLLDKVESAPDAYALRPDIMYTLFALMQAGEKLYNAAHAVRERL